MFRMRFRAMVWMRRVGTMFLPRRLPRMMEGSGVCSNQVFIFAIGWVAYALTYFLRKPLGVIKADMESELSLSKSHLGLLDTALFLPYAVMQMLLGPLGDKYGSRRTFGICMILSALSTISFGHWNSLTMFAVLLFLNGTFQSQCWPNVTKVLTTWFSEEVRNSVFGIFGTCVFTGGILSTMFAVYLQTHYGWRTVFFLPSVFVLLAGVVVLVSYRTAEEAGHNLKGAAPNAEKGAEKPLAEETSSGQVVTIWELWKMPMVMEAAVGMFCLKVVRYSMYMWLPMYLLQQLEYTKPEAGMLSVAFEVGGVAGTALIGLVLDRLFKGQSLLGTGLSMLLSAGALVLFALTGSWGVFCNILFLGLAGAFNAGPDTILGGTIPVEIAQQDGRNAAGATIGFVNGFGSLGSCLEGPLVGFVSSQFGWDKMFYVMTGLSTLGAVAVFRAAVLKSRKYSPVMDTPPGV